MNTKQFKRAISSFVAASNGLVESFRKASIEAGFPTWEDAEPVVMQWVSETYKVALVESQSPRNKGALVLDRSAQRFEAAKKAAQRIREALVGDADAAAAKPSNKASEKEEVEVPAHIAALAAKLAAACNEYQQSKKLAAQAVAEAFASK